MNIKTEMVGQTFGPFVREYTFRDLELFALGSGAAIDGRTGLEYVDEKDPGKPQLKVLPTIAAMPIVDQVVTKTIDYGYNYAGSLHWSFDIKFHGRPIPQDGSFVTKVRLEGLYDRGAGKGLLAQHVGDTYDADGNLLFTNESWDCLIYDGGWGGPAAPKDVVEMPDRAPDFEAEERVPFNQALIYRLSGDWHPQHIDWDYAAENGQRRPILHAVSTAGYACRAFVDAFVPGEPERITRFKTRITSPVLPGATLVTQFWRMDDTRVHFRVIDAFAPAKPYLNWGVIEWA
ncbi:3-alpha,7-alpha,12-alpha-trihydroxy-5-beta-cholest-24-enoyl-CoA hydratase [Xylanimonas allomyrinae]|uniref:3-alpha,7-alpha, 12-alpha-trihydroxy-5-beta-cholest-24-enoyl-CoA hydratase n=1 Tax=Xylanimonas allomyrinae TaxID=2509459 RepID=A0A4P6ESM3_9MICO|nr:MaoC/PaaZ C-terminal domain-containing protein [Xylanimonas allomyrinae]QAY64549.1 3-alpha,7-alpha,12-alpha-trihydroxy-5-beta-cholest-24-enoyl-CoA hydratase [Xylanimonas allomyrinae]